MGRGREIAIFARLLEEGLASSLRLLSVSGQPGMGRRRLIQEALRRGPDAEWVHLAPGGVEPDLERWVRTELPDLLATYPDAPYPGWALRTLAAWQPELRSWAPGSSAADRPNPDDRPTVFGAAVGALLVALTGQTSVLVDVGVWPIVGEREEMMSAMSRSLARPGVLVLGASHQGFLTDTDDVRLVPLEALRHADVAELVTKWSSGRPNEPIARWLTRITRGEPFALHETVRWLEESGHVRVDEERGEVEFLAPPHELPLPLNLGAVLDGRYQRLDRETKRLLHLLTEVDGELEMEELRDRFHAEAPIFDASLSVLRRRGYLLRRTFRRPLALSSTVWRDYVALAISRFHRFAHRPRRAPKPAPRPVPSPLGRLVTQLDARLKGDAAMPFDIDTVRGEIAVSWRRARRRPGTGWASARARIALLASCPRLGGGRDAQTLRWVNAGLRDLDPHRQTGLRRSLLQVRARSLTALGRPLDASAVRLAALNEATEAGHLLAAARLRAAWAEGLRRLGDLDGALTASREAADALDHMGLRQQADCAGFTRIQALLDARRLEDAGDELALRFPHGSPLADELAHRGLVLEAEPPLPGGGGDGVPPGGWRWGLDTDTVWMDTRTELTRAGRAVLENEPWELAQVVAALEPRLVAAGQRTALADLAEIQVWAALEGPETTLTERVRVAVERARGLGVPDRCRFLAASMESTPIQELPEATALLGPLLMHPVEVAARSRLHAVRLHLLGRPRIVFADREWPLGLWPEWYRELLAAVIAGDLLDRPLTREGAQALLHDTLDTPDDTLIGLVDRANELTRGRHAFVGGIRLETDRLAMDWAGIWCDVRVALETRGDATTETYRPGATDAWSVAMREALAAHRTADPAPGKAGDGVVVSFPR